MVCESESDHVEDIDIEVLSSMWPEDINEAGKQFNMEKPGTDQDMLEEVTINEDATTIVDFKRLLELTNYSEKGSSQLAYLVKNWEFKHANAVRLLQEELDNLNKQQQESELKKLEILEEHRFEEERYGGDKRPVSILDDNLNYAYHDIPRRKNDVIIHDKRLEIDAEYDSILYWKQRAMHLEKLLEASIQREQILLEKLHESIENLERQTSPVEELSQVLKRADNFLHFILQNAPVVIGHQDKELRYRFIYNHFPSLREEDIIGKTDIEIFAGAGVKESQDFKREVLERGLPAKREITFETELFGLKTFLIYVEPVFSKAGETIGVNYMGMEVTDQSKNLRMKRRIRSHRVDECGELINNSNVYKAAAFDFTKPLRIAAFPKIKDAEVRKREKMAKLREEIAVQKAKETELNRTIHITEETMRAKQMLATMSHEIRSPLSGVVSMTEILSTTKLDKEQRQLVNVMLSSGDLVLQLINDILDLSKVESGVMKLEATKFRPREVVKHVLQTAAASLQKLLTLEGHVADDVPVEVIGDVLRIRQILTNLISNAIKFTHEGKVGIKLYVVPQPHLELKQNCDEKISFDQSNVPASISKEDRCLSPAESLCHPRGSFMQNNGEGSHKNAEQNILKRNDTLNDEPSTVRTILEENHPDPQETIVWLCCDVYDTGIGIPENALPTLFKKYMQVGADTARKYGGTGLGLAICKQLVELMGGHLTVSSKEHFGSTFTFVLPYKVSPVCDSSDDNDELSDMDQHDVHTDVNEDDMTCGFFQFQPRTLGTLFSSQGSGRTQKLLPNSVGYNTMHKSTRFHDDYYSISSENNLTEVTSTAGDTSAIALDEKSFEPRSSTSYKARCDNQDILAESRHAQDDRNNQFPGQCMHSPDSSRISKDCSASSGITLAQQTSQTQVQSDRSSECSSSSSPEITKSLMKPRILLVEDNKINVMVTKSMMKQLGHNLDVVNNGVEAVRAVQRSNYDLILMDVCMPVMDGLHATRLIRAFEESGSWDAAARAGIEPPELSCSDHFEDDQAHKRSIKRIPIIAMTANALLESADECHANGMDSFVSKPVTFQTLKDCLQEYLP